MSYTKSKALAFQKTVWKHYKEQGRHDLPWRKTHDPYKILVSEIMLQQTQVDRVKSYYENFLHEFPTVEDLAAAPLSKVLSLWQGLGYNRRAKLLHETAKEVASNYTGKFPRSVEELQKLRGIGPYTASAIAAFAYNQDVIFIETNLRTAITYHFLMKENEINDKEILKILEKVFRYGEKKSREWNSALMDYGAHLKRSGIRINHKSKTYNKQSKFTGSNREARGAVLRELSKGPQTKTKLANLLGKERKSQLEEQLQKLLNERLIEKRLAKPNYFQLPA